MNIEKAIEILTEYKNTGTYKCSLSELITAIDIVLKELEYYKDIIGALSEYYSITIDDIEECIKKDR